MKKGEIKRVGIRGAGVAGLSIARELIRSSPEINIAIFDYRLAKPYPKRTFCFFSGFNSQHVQEPYHAWPRIKFSGNTFERTIQTDDHPYVMIKGDKFFSAIQSELISRGVTFFWGQTDVKIKDQVIVADSINYDFDYVVDAAFDSSNVKAHLWQSFAGYWVTTETDTFDPSTATLMALDQSTEMSPISFMYILPTSSREALVEHTTFSIQPLPKTSHLQKCDEWISKNIIGTVIKDAEENGAIPMGVKNKSVVSGFKIGSGAGAIRPGTGYAFEAIQRQAEELSRMIVNPAKSLATDRSFNFNPYPYLLVQADLLFIKSLTNRPKNGGLILGRLLKFAPAKPLVKFLAGSASLLEALRVMLAVPKITMLRSLLRK